MLIAIVWYVTTPFTEMYWMFVETTCCILYHPLYNEMKIVKQVMNEIIHLLCNYIISFELTIKLSIIK